MNGAEPAPLGVWLVGARGSVATVTMAGAAAVARGLVPPTGMVTEHEPLDGVPMSPLGSLAFGGHDVRGGSVAESARALAREPEVLDPSVLAALDGDLERLEAHVRPAPQAPPGAPAREEVRAIREDIDRFARETGARRVVVVNVASTEPPVPDHPAHHDPAALEAALDEPEASGALPPSARYAYAALSSGRPYVNFTPSTGASLPSLERLALERGVPHAGRDGKTGETLLKTVLAPMFAMRRLRVRGWAGLNLLGNGDGRTLADPEASRSKVASKGRAVPRILGYEADTVVRIDYVPSLGDRKVAWDLIDFEGFLGSPMSLQLTWRASDSALAAPLVLDLARLMDLAAERGAAGAQGHLAFFFKDPLGSDVHDLSAQFAMLREHIGC
ncbi:MAG: inositol-3-phosphate synthase [Thermoleophilia bacterium]